MTTDVSEKGLETIIMRHMTGEDGLAVAPDVAVAKAPPFGGAGYVAGSTKSFDRAPHKTDDLDADWDVSTDVSPPSAGCGPRPTSTSTPS